MDVNYFARNIYEAETVISGPCYIEYLIFLENNILHFEILWISSLPIVSGII